MATPTAKVIKFWPILALIIIWLIFTWPFWLKGLIPAPLDFLTNFYAPWQGFYNLPIKNPAISDVVNQIIPWKLFTIDTLKSGQIPLWNPYNFSGTPHAANWQSAVFYPLNAIFMLLRFDTAWSLFILLQPLLAGLFTYLFVSQLKRSPIASLLAALSFMFGGFMTTWLEWGTLGHALLWLPLTLYSIELFKSTKKISFYYLSLASLSLSLLAGHLQVSLYVILLSFLYFLTRCSSRHKFWLAAGLLVTPFLLISFQLLPSLELYLNSFRSQSLDPGWFKAFRIPLSGLATFLAPDFFGNPVTRNHFSNYSYVEMMGYIGLIPFLLALITLFKSKKAQSIKFFWFTVLISLLLSLKTPLANILVWLRLPIFASSSPARIISLTSFSLSVLSAFGLDYFFKLKHQDRVRFLVFLGAIFAALWLSAFIFKLPISQRNLILPTAIFMLFTLIALLHFKSKIHLFLVSCFLFLVAASDLFRFHHKFTPYTLKDYWYPTFGVMNFLKTNQGIDRNFGLFDAQLNLPFKLYSTQGYDTLFPKNYGKLLQLNTTGRVSAATIPKSSPQTMPLLNLLGVKYVIQPVVHGAAPWELRLWEYPGQFKEVYKDRLYQVFENLESQPRISLSQGSFNLEAYTPNQIKLKTNTSTNAQLVLSDNYYPGWQARIDGQITSINQTDSNFRQINIPPGQHQVIFRYQPLSFTLGLGISAVTLLALLLFKIK